MKTQTNMENTLENKAKFFAQYFGQEVRIWKEMPENNCNVGYSALSSDAVNCSHLKLTPLSAITDDDKWELGIRVNCWNNSERKQDWFTRKDDDFHRVHISQGEMFASAIGKEFGWGMSHPFANNSTDILNAYDYLRSKGYALPFMGLSVEKQIEYGWIKLKTNE